MITVKDAGQHVVIPASTQCRFPRLCMHVDGLIFDNPSMIILSVGRWFNVILCNVRAVRCFKETAPSVEDPPVV